MSKKCILLGVTGGIAAYKSVDLCSKLSTQGYDVCVIMTESARKLVSECLFRTLSKNPVVTDLLNLRIGGPAMLHWLTGRI